jgi:hypothetical protein
MNFVASFDVIVATAQTSIHLVSLSITTGLLGAILKGPTKSRPHIVKGQDGGIVLRA